MSGNNGNQEKKRELTEEEKEVEVSPVIWAWGVRRIPCERGAHAAPCRRADHPRSIGA